MDLRCQLSGALIEALLWDLSKHAFDVNDKIKLVCFFKYVFP